MFSQHKIKFLAMTGTSDAMVVIFYLHGTSLLLKVLLLKHVIHTHQEMELSQNVFQTDVLKKVKLIRNSIVERLLSRVNQQVLDKKSLPMDQWRLDLWYTEIS